ncbi:unnamed protein product [Cuscuta campestris]|uniref:Retrotransposon gag domain-containing protein n=1 Tax=Cuscuta campestris TaxID=132261 RepID=A0A484M751_9ASTE|nr:unnamed protein product [Cuscuta campestris]
MSNESRTMSHEELIASNTALKAQVEYLAKEVAKLTKIKLNELQGSDREEDVSSSGTMKPKATEGSDFKVDIPTFEGKNDPEEFLEWIETVEHVFDFKDVSDEKKVKIVALKFRKTTSIRLGYAVHIGRSAALWAVQKWAEWAAKFSRLIFKILGC